MIIFKLDYLLKDLMKKILIANRGEIALYAEEVADLQCFQYGWFRIELHQNAIDSDCVPVDDFNRAIQPNGYSGTWTAGDRIGKVADNAGDN